MNLALYELKKAEREKAKKPPRPLCLACRKARVTCYCHLVRAFRSDPEFVILIHQGEARRGIATGRMAHLVLNNSTLVQGTNFSNHERVNQILEDPMVYPVVLYPSPQALNVSRLSAEERTRWVPRDKRLVIFVIDGTWATARKMRRYSRNLHSLPYLSLTPRTPSQFQVRKQPKPHCLSTLEAIHELIELLSPEDPTRPHDNLLTVFRYMVEQQVQYGQRNQKRALRGRR
jgi:DTW domain-containing protein